MNSSLRFGLGFTSVICLLAAFGPWISNSDPNAMSLSLRYAGPSLNHIFGLDQNGSDIFSKVAVGARLSLLICLTTVFVQVSVGLVLGSVASFVGGWADLLLMRFIEILNAFPGFLLAIAVVATLGPSISHLILALCLTGWTGYARLVRAEVLHLKERESIQAARAIGATRTRILTLHIWPQLIGVLVVQATFGLAGTALVESSLNFLGLGAPATTPTWGALLNAGRKVIIEAPQVSLFPGLALAILVLGFNFLGEGLRDALDPRRTS